MLKNRVINRNILIIILTVTACFLAACGKDNDAGNGYDININKP